MARGKLVTRVSLLSGARLIFVVIATCLVLTSCLGVDARKNPRRTPSRPPSPQPPPAPTPKLRGPRRKASPSPVPMPTPSPSPSPTLKPMPEPTPVFSPEASPAGEVLKKPSAAETRPQSISLSRGGWGSEENVCNEWGLCGSGARAEVLVTPGGEDADCEPTWAPLCAADALNETLQWTLAYVVCNQFYNWPSFENFRRNPNGLASVFGWREQPLLVPAEAPAAGSTDMYGEPLFDPTKYTHWATVTGWVDVASPSDVRSVQELPMTVSTTPCSEGRMFAVYCSLTVADRHRRQ